MNAQKITVRRSELGSTLAEVRILWEREITKGLSSEEQGKFADLDGAVWAAVEDVILKLERGSHSDLMLTINWALATEIQQYLQRLPGEKLISVLLSVTDEDVVRRIESYGVRSVSD